MIFQREKSHLRLEAFTSECDIHIAEITSWNTFAFLLQSFPLFGGYAASKAEDLKARFLKIAVRLPGVSIIARIIP